MNLNLQRHSRHSPQAVTQTHSLVSFSTAAHSKSAAPPQLLPVAGVSRTAVRSVAPPRKLAAALAAQHDEAHHRLEGHHPHGAQQPAHKPDGVLEQLAHEQLALRHEQVRGAAERHDALPAHNKPGQPTTARAHGSPRAATLAAALGRRLRAQLVVVFPQLLQRLGVLLLLLLDCLLLLLAQWRPAAARVTSASASGLAL